MTVPNISQSLLKGYLDYTDDNVRDCGIAFRKRYLERVKSEPSAVQKLGLYFEYKATGYHNMKEPVPEPEMVYKNTAKEKLAAEYERANASAEFFKQIVKKHNLQDITYGQYFLHDGSSMITDMMCTWNERRCIIDMKYTSLFDDKFNEYGWHTESLPYKSKLMLQPVHYKWLDREITGMNDIDFYFWIFSAKDPEKMKIIKVNVQDEHIDLHGNVTIPKVKKHMEYYAVNPHKLEPRPNYLRCKECPYFEGCEYKAEVPLIEEVYY
jgi:hypothetical protein